MENIVNAEELKSMLEKQNLEKNQTILLFDVRRKPDYLADPALIPGAQWHNPEDIEQWSESIAENRQVVIYCVKGGSVSKSVSEFLINKQIPTAYLEGGIKAWRDSGGEVI